MSKKQVNSGCLGGGCGAFILVAMPICAIPVQFADIPMYCRILLIAWLILGITFFVFSFRRIQQIQKARGTELGLLDYWIASWFFWG
ncbi:MAG: hypothetical protein LBL13_03050 [Bacteroidales bacterium]|jgi:hypothetical protein|nr:hypothetical protein [Bacteroidales bacterium]